MSSHSASGCTDGGGDTVSSEEAPFFTGQVRGIASLTLDASAKLALRGKIESSLHHIFQVPQLIDGLTDYLSEVVAEDDQSAVVLGV